MELTNIEHNIILGTLLGDGMLQHRSKKARLRISHSIHQKAYVDWKYFQLKRLCERTKPPQIQKVQFGTGYYFSTQSEKILLKYHDLFYKGTTSSRTSTIVEAPNSIKYRKSITPQLLDFIKNPLSLAVWWLDDGNSRTDCFAGRFATQSYTLEEHKILQKILFSNFQIDSNIVRHSARKQQYYLYISGKNNNFSTFVNLITPYIYKIPSMKYKLGKKPRND